METKREDDDLIQILDTKKLAVTGTLPSGADPELLILSPDGKLLYISQTASPSSTPRRKRSRNICSSASASGNWH
jgi:DNA-binding beta-propeller fold protein YncE